MRSNGPSEGLTRWVLPRLAAASLLVAFLAVPAIAQSGPVAEGYQRRLEQWRALSPQKRQRILNRWTEYQKLPVDKKHEIDSRLKTWQNMKTEDRSRLREKYDRFRRLPAEERNRLIESYRGLPRSPALKEHYRPRTSRPRPGVPYRH